MDCREVRDLLDSYLGQELLVETNHEVIRHLETCAGCRTECETRRQLRATLRRAFNESPGLQPRSSFSAEALASVRGSARRPRRRWLQAWAPIAASLVLIAGAALFMFLTRTRGTADLRAAVGDHLNCAVKFHLAERPITLADAATRFDPFLARLEQTPPADVTTAAGPLHVLERHSCVFAGHRYGHVVLEFDKHLVSLLVTGGEAPGSIADVQTLAAHAVDRIQGQRVTSFDLDGHNAYVVSDLGEAQFRQVADALASVSNRVADVAAVR